MCFNINKKIDFSPPCIIESDLKAAVSALKSGWITTGPRTKLFEKKLSSYCGTKKTACLSSATASMELCLRLFGIKEGDEVITTPYTYTASCSVICHVGATPILIDLERDSFYIDLEKLERAITPKTKVIIAVDIAGRMCDYEKILQIVNNKKNIFESSNKRQKDFGRVLVIADAAHSFGASFDGKKSGTAADFTAFSFHAVKNLTTAEGGALTWRDNKNLDDEKIYKELMLLSLHGQSKDALEKSKLSSWEYDIKILGYKFNMTDVLASVGLSMLSRYNDVLKRRKEIINRYNSLLSKENIGIFPHFDKSSESSGHLYITRVLEKSENFRNKLIERMSEKNIATNVHYKPLPMFSAYKNLGFSIKDFKNAFLMYENEITLPLHNLLTDEDVDYVAKSFKECLFLESK